MNESVSTIVVGGGMAGMSCALRLKECGIPVTLVTDFIGGRVYYSKRTKMNFGAVFYMENYKNARKLLTPGPRLAFPMGDIELHNSETDIFCARSFRIFRQLPQLLKFRRFMKKFMVHYQTYKDQCEHTPVSQALNENPFLKRLYHQSAAEVIREIGIEGIASDFLSKFAYACTGAKVQVLNGLDYLNTLQGTVIPIYTFTFDEEDFVHRLGAENLVLERVQAVTRGDGQHTVTTASGKQLRAHNVVLATPAHVTQELIDIGPIRSYASLWSGLVKGELKAPYNRRPVNYFSDKFDIIATLRRASDVEYEVYATREIDLKRYFHDPELVKGKFWEAALFVQGDTIMKQSLGGGLYTAGDHNGLGMEPAAISGLYAANCIQRARA